MTTALEFSSFTLIVDDIVFPDGRTRMGMLGGGGPQTIFGYQLRRRQQAPVGLAAAVGPDLPTSCKETLQRMSVDVSGLVLRPDKRTPRAWQVFEEDGRRTQVWRTEYNEELDAMLRPAYSELPPHFKSAHNFHFGVGPLDPPLTLLSHLRRAAHGAGGFLSIETYTWAERRPTPEELTALVTSSDIFSPNEMEAVSLVGPGSPIELVDRLIAAGAGIVTLRRGDSGTLVKDGRTGECWQVPAFPGTHVVDVTGCGNAFCGAFLAEYAQSQNLLESALWACASGSIMAEYEGIPGPPPAELHEAAAARREAILPRATLVQPKHRSLTIAACAQHPGSRGDNRRRPTGVTSCRAVHPSQAWKSMPSSTRLCDYKRWQLHRSCRVVQSGRIHHMASNHMGRVNWKKLCGGRSVLNGALKFVH